MGTTARQLRLFLIRHGETVDNVAQLYAGSRDSALTNHGYQQATRLGQHFKALGLTFTHIFSSHLQRAVKTAGLIREAQIASGADHVEARTVPDVVQLPVLMEQDFGSHEGKKWNERAADSRLSGKEQHKQAHKNDEGFVDIESKESMGVRVDTFLDEYLLPLLDEQADGVDKVAAVVSHGILLSALWKRLLQRLPPRSVSLSPDLAATARPSLEHLGGWSNTGYLELLMSQKPPKEPDMQANVLPPSDPLPAAAEVSVPASHTADSPTKFPHVATEPLLGYKSGLEDSLGISRPESIQAAGSPCAPTLVDVAKQELPSSSALSAPITGQPRNARLAHVWTTEIQTINGRDHLKGLKRTGGGVGSSRHDISQKNIDTFFKRQKLA